MGSARGQGTPETVIVGINGRAQDGEALALARRLTREGAEISAVSIGLVDERTASFAARAAADRAAIATIEKLQRQRWNGKCLASTAPSVGRGLAEVAQTQRADLIVVASSRRGGMKRVLAGDAVADVLRFAPCPVAISPVGYRKGRPIKTVLVAHDGSVEADQAMRRAVGIADALGARISVVEVVEPFVALAPPAPAALERDYARARRNLDYLSDQFGVHGVIATGRASHEVAQASLGADLLCVGLHRRTGLPRLLPGGMVQSLLHHVGGPMLVVPPEYAEAADPALARASVPVEALDFVPATALAESAGT